MNIAPAWYKQEDAVEAGLSTVDIVPPVTSRDSAADQAAGVTTLQELGAAACATNTLLPCRRNRVDRAMQRERLVTAMAAPHFSGLVHLIDLNYWPTVPEQNLQPRTSACR
jgi:hypothetical protein